MSVKSGAWSLEFDFPRSGWKILLCNKTRGIGFEVMEKEKTVKFKSKRLAVRIVNLYKYLCNEKKEFVLSKQLLRSGTSIGANIAESECAISQKDFLSKIYIALKECAETIYWIELLFETEYLTNEEYQSIKSDCEEIRKMLSSTTKTINSTLNPPNSTLSKGGTTEYEV